ncbi:MAG: hypothetical protein SFX73_30915 [Kofleriaceae bacterium]|nr:hypothetical protein [Kofleriaceae bacterium]
MLRAALVGATLMLVSTSANAVAPRTGPRLAAQHLTAMPAAGTRKPLRAAPEVRYATVASPAWKAFTAAAGGRWRAAYDRATGVPNRIWGSGIFVFGSVGSATIAESFARQWLAAHIDLVAPGSTPSDFELVSNHSDGEIRSLGFVQRSDGRLVVGGQLSFRFKRDRLVAIGSEALPEVKATAQRPRARITRAAIHMRATTALRRDLALPSAPVTAPGDEVVLPLVADDAVLGYRITRPLTIDGGVEGRYLAYADVATGEVLAVHQLNAYATGTLVYRGVDRYPGRPRIDIPAPRAAVTVDGAPQTTTPTGMLTWGSEAPVSVATAVVGDLIQVINKNDSEGILASALLTLAPNGTAVWDATSNPIEDAQLNVYLHANRVKDFVATHLDPELPLLGERMNANVNIGQECNAFFDGTSINFFQSSMKCENTGLVEDVIHHEFGHALHSAEIVRGVGSFDGAMSEGAADFLAASISNDSGMGRGFFYVDAPLRELDPADKEYRWPEDILEIHHTGMIYGGALWDLRKALIAAFGETEGVRIVQKIYIGTLRRSTSIPTSLIEALVEDDDDGNLDNGTPHECFIRDAYGRHGLRTASGNIVAPSPLVQQAKSTLVRIELSGLTDRCNGDEIESVTVDWRPSSTVEPAAGSAVATRATDDVYFVQLPLAIEGKIFYRARVKFADGSILTLADNLADPYYELYQGHTVPLYCTDFEDEDPFQEGWTTGTSNDQVASEWEWGEPGGGATDPPFAYSGTHILAQKLGGDYGKGITSWIKSPPIDVGRWTDVHLQYRRWLAVEDSHFDQARVTVNDKRAWLNYTANLGDSSATHHIDREWRYHDVALSGYSPTNVFTVGWDITTDQGLELGGWQLDDVCIVANINSVCGDGVKSPTEGCDEGVMNVDEPDRCRTYCLRPACGDSILDANEECDHGAGDATCSSTCQSLELPTLGGCCSANRGASGSLALATFVSALVLRRRRRG